VALGGTILYVISNALMLFLLALMIGTITVVAFVTVRRRKRTSMDSSRRAKGPTESVDVQNKPVDRKAAARRMVASRGRPSPSESIPIGMSDGVAASGRSYPSREDPIPPASPSNQVSGSWKSFQHSQDSNPRFEVEAPSSTGTTTLRITVIVNNGPAVTRIKGADDKS